MSCSVIALSLVKVDKKTTKEEVNAALKKAADGPLNGVLGYTELPLVSSDFKGTNVSATVDGQLSMVMGEDRAVAQGLKTMPPVPNVWLEDPPLSPLLSRLGRVNLACAFFLRNIGPAHKLTSKVVCCFV